MGSNVALPPSQRYAHLAGAMPCPVATATTKSEAEIAIVLARLQRGPVASDGIRGLPQARVSAIVRILKRRGHHIHKVVQRDVITHQQVPAIFALVAGKVRAS